MVCFIGPFGDKHLQPLQQLFAPRCAGLEFSYLLPRERRGELGEKLHVLLMKNAVLGKEGIPTKSTAISEMTALACASLRRFLHYLSTLGPSAALGS